jgi:hypothetical protein
MAERNRFPRKYTSKDMTLLAAALPATSPLQRKVIQEAVPRLIEMGWVEEVVEAGPRECVIESARDSGGAEQE